MKKISLIFLVFLSLLFSACKDDKEEINNNQDNNSVEGYVDHSKNYHYTKSTFPLGGNIGGPFDWSRGNIFVDLVKQVQFFGTADQPWVKGIKTDENGWPLEDFGIMLFRDPFSIGNAGTYKIIFNCSVIPNITTNASSGEITNLKRDDLTGVVTADLTTPKQDQLFLSFRNTNGGVKNLKVLRPGYNENQTFTNECLNHIDRFSTIRIMDTVWTNASEEVSWSARQKPTDGPFGEKKNRGVAWEYCIELANTTKADLWINIPHMADENYIRSLAKLIKGQLDPDLNVYVEYSNEMWNWLFPQSHWALETANKEPYLSMLSFDGETNPGYLHFRLVGEKIKECSDIFGEVFGKDQINKRIRPVLCGQIVYGITYEEPLKYIAGKYGDPNKYIYAIGGAPYFNMGEEMSAKEVLTVDDIISGFNKTVDVDVPAAIENMKNFAVEYNLKMVCYEGGPDTYAPGSGNLKEKEASQKDPRIKDIIVKYLENWYYSGGDLFCWYLAGASSWDSQYGSFGLINEPDKDIGPKVEAVDKVIAGGTDKYAAGQLPTDNPKMDINGTKTVIDFEDITESGADKSIGTSITNKGYVFTDNSQICTVKTLGNWTESYNSIVLHGFSWGSIMRIARSDKKPFSIKEIRILRPYNLEQAVKVKITGYMHTRGSVTLTLDIPESSKREGILYEFPKEWYELGMKEMKFEFMDSSNTIKYGAIDDITIFDTVLP